MVSSNDAIISDLQRRIRRASKFVTFFVCFMILGLIIPVGVLIVAIQFFNLNLAGDGFVILALTGIFTPLFGFGGFFLSGSPRSRYRRSLEVAQLASSMGLAFSEKAPQELLAFVKSLRFFELSSNITGTNYCNGKLDGVLVEMIDLGRQYPSPLGSGYPMGGETLVLVRTLGGIVPDFMMCPTNWAGKLAGKLFGEGIDLTDHPDFANRFAVHSQDETGTRAFLNDKSIALLSSDTYTAEIRQGTLVMFKEKRILAATEIQQLIDTAKGLVEGVSS
jgi:hypothetical protein